MNDEVFLATRDRVLECAYEVLNEQVTPYEGAKRMWAMQYEIDDLIELRERLTIFVGLAAAWEDVPEHPEVQQEYERRIVSAAESLRRSYGG